MVLQQTKYHGDDGRRNVLKSIGWAAMGMSAATCYELHSLQNILSDSNAKGLAGLAFWIHQAVILFCVIYVGIGSLSTPPTGAVNPHVPDPTIFRASIATLTFTAITYTVSHTVLMAQESMLKAEAEQTTKKEKQVIIDRIKTCFSKTNSIPNSCLEEIK